MGQKLRYLKALFFIIFSLVIYSCNEGDGSDTTILENGFYFNGTSFTAFKELIIKGDKIADISTEHTGKKGLRIDLSGKYVIPGLVDAHVHLAGNPLYTIGGTSTPEHNANSSLNCGVTTVIDLFYRENKCKELRTILKSAPAYYTTPFLAGPILTAPEGHGTEYGVPTRTITSVAEAESITNDVIDGGADLIKLVYEAQMRPKHTLSKQMVEAIVRVAHKRNKKVFAHIRYAAEAIDCIEAGVDVLAHMAIDSFTNDQLNLLKTKGVVIIPTISVIQTYREGYDDSFFADSLLLKTGYEGYMSKLKGAYHGKFVSDSVSAFRQNLSNCIKMNIPILAGTDAGNYLVFYGYSLHNEIQQYVKAGMTTAQALCSATQNIQLVFPDLKVGKIKEGYDADLVVLNDNPLKNIANTKSIQMVFHKGMQAKTLK